LLLVEVVGQALLVLVEVVVAVQEDFAQGHQHL
jgi:hypothetical protein